MTVENVTFFEKKKKTMYSFIYVLVLSQFEKNHNRYTVQYTIYV